MDRIRNIDTGYKQTGKSGRQPALLQSRTGAVQRVFDRVGKPINLYRETGDSTIDGYGKENSDAVFVEESVAVLSTSGSGASRPERQEQPHGERVTWQPNILLPRDCKVQEGDVIEFNVDGYQNTPTTDSELWSVQTIVQYATHFEAQGTRVVD